MSRRVPARLRWALGLGAATMLTCAPLAWATPAWADPHGHHPQPGHCAAHRPGHAGHDGSHGGGHGAPQTPRDHQHATHQRAIHLHAIHHHGVGPADRRGPIPDHHLVRDHTAPRPRAAARDAAEAARRAAEAAREQAHEAAKAAHPQRHAVDKPPPPPVHGKGPGNDLTSWTSAKITIKGRTTPAAAAPKPVAHHHAVRPAVHHATRRGSSGSTAVNSPAATIRHGVAPQHSPAPTRGNAVTAPAPRHPTHVRPLPQTFPQPTNTPKHQPRSPAGPRPTRSGGHQKVLPPLADRNNLSLQSPGALGMLAGLALVVLAVMAYVAWTGRRRHG